MATSEDKYNLVLKRFGIKEYHDNGYLGQGVTIATVESTTSSHGSMVCDTIRTYSPNARIISYNDENKNKSATGDDGINSNFMDFVNWCIKNGADIITSSLDWTCDKEEEQEAIRKLYDNGIIFFNCAGNSGKEITRKDTLRNTWDFDEEVITVSAISMDMNEKITWSGFNYGEAVDVVTLGSSVPVKSTADKWYSWGGTSSSTPLMASMFALIKSTGIKLTSKSSLQLIKLYSESYKYKDREYNMFIMPPLSEVLNKKEEVETMSNINKYSYSKDGDTQLSKHFKAKEFGDIYNGTLISDDILISQNLIDMLEKIIDKLSASSAYITSGYRSLKCDSLVTGTVSKGTSQHCKGTAADVIFYDTNKNVIDTKIVSCVAQDLGFTGIARISNSATHLDVRTGNRYYGDEMTGHTNTVTNDFYSYYGIKKESEIEKAISNLVQANVISSSEYWLEHYNDVKYLKELIIKFSKYIDNNK